MAPSTLPVPCPSWAIPGSSNLPQSNPGQETSCARLGVGVGGTREQDSCYFLDATVGHNRIPAWLHTLTDSLSQAPALNGALPTPVSSDPSQGHSPTPHTVLVQVRRDILSGLGEWWSLQGSTGGGGSPAPHRPLAHPPGCFPQPHTHQIPHMPVCL